MHYEGDIVNEMEPSQVAVLTLMILDNTPLAVSSRNGTFRMPDRRTLFQELRTLVQHLDLARGQFQANHASNYFNLDGRLPRDKQRFLDTIDRVLAGLMDLKPERARAL